MYVTTDTIIVLVEVVLKNTIFTFGKKALTQKLGTVIGAKFAPPHSNFIYGRTGRKCN